MPAGGTAVGTIVAKNFLSVRAGAGRSLREHHPEVPFFVVLADRAEGMFDPATEPFEIISLGALGIPDLRSHVLSILTTAGDDRRQAASSALPAGPRIHRRHVSRRRHPRRGSARSTARRDCGACCRPDAPSARLFVGPRRGRARAQHPSVGRLQRRLHRRLGTCVRAAGSFHGGKIACTRIAVTKSAEGMHYDQRWLDLAPAFFDDVHIMRDAGCNIAHWNLPERDAHLGAKGGRPTAHRADSSTSAVSSRSGPGPSLGIRAVSRWKRSGLRPPSSIVTCACSTRMAIRPAGTGRTRSAVLTTASRFRMSRVECTRIWAAPRPRSAIPSGSPGAAATFTGSTSRLITPPARAVQSRVCGKRCIEADPICSGPFPTSSGADHRAFLNWIVTNGLREHDIPEAFAPS